LVCWSGVGALFCFLLLRRTVRCASSRLHLRAFFYQKIFKGKKIFQVRNTCFQVGFSSSKWKKLQSKKIFSMSRVSKMLAQG
jgi:hypothetical protein